MAIFPRHFLMYILLANFQFFNLQSQFPTRRKISFPDLYPLIRPLRIPLAFGRGNSFGHLLRQTSTNFSPFSRQQVQVGILIQKGKIRSKNFLYSRPTFDARVKLLSRRNIIFPSCEKGNSVIQNPQMGNIILIFTKSVLRNLAEMLKQKIMWTGNPTTASS